MNKYDCQTCILAYETSLGRLSEAEWNTLRNLHAGGMSFVKKLHSGRGWVISDAVAKGFGIFRTKREAAETVARLIEAESKHRHLIRHEAERRAGQP